MNIFPLNHSPFKLNKSSENQTEATKNNENTTQEMATPVTATEEEVDEFIEQSIQINSNKQMRMEYLYPWTLKFKDSTQEIKYCQLREDMFRSNMLSVFIVWIFIVLCQVTIIPQCTVLTVCLAISTALLTCGCLLVMAEEFSTLPLFFQKSSAALVHKRDRRTLFICAVIFLMSAASSIGLFMCPMDLNHLETNSTVNSNSTNSRYDTEFILDFHISAIVHKNISERIDSKLRNASKIQQFMSNELNNIRAEILDKLANKTTDRNYSKNGDDLLKLQNEENSTHIVDKKLTMGLNAKNNHCSHPEYLVFTWVLCLIALATGLKLYYLVKTFMATIMVCCYAILISIAFPEVFDVFIESEDSSKYGMPLTARMNILLIVFLTMVTYHARLVEVTSRLDFIWKEQAEKELTNMKSNRILNDLLIKARYSIYVMQYRLTVKP